MWRKAVTLEELSLMTDEQVMMKINEFLVPANKAGAPANSDDLVGAQFYMAELDRRAARKLEKERQAAEAKRDRIDTRRRRIDLGLELLIVALIGFELLLGWSEGEKQFAVLNQIQQNAAATTSTILTLQKTIQDMSAHISEELSLNYEPAVAAVYDTNTAMIHITNNSPTAISIYGYYSGDYQVMFPKPFVILPHGTDDLNNGPFYSEQKEKLHYTSANFPFAMFFRTKNGDEYTLNADINVEALPTTGFFVRLVLVKVHREAWGYRLKSKKWN